MPNLTFQIDSAETIPYAASPMLAFKLRVEDHSPDEQVHSILLRCQIQIDCLRRRYGGQEQNKLFDLFGPPEDWGRTLRRMLWTQLSLSVPGFVGTTVVDLPVPCTYDLNLAATKYFHALEGGEIPLSLLFSGTVFYAAGRMPLQVAQVPWDKEATFRLPVRVWQEMMERYYPNSAWLYLRKDVLDRLYQYKNRGGFATWEQAMEELLASVGEGGAS